MWRLYNIAGLEPVVKAVCRKTAIFAVALAVSSVTLSCRRGAGELASTPSSVPTTAETVATADRLYQERADVMKVRQALIALRQGGTSNPTDYELAWRLAKFNYYLGSHTSDLGEKEKAFHDGIEAGRLAVKLNNERAEGHFWLGANYGGNAEVSTLAGLTDIEDIKREMETVLKIDDRYEGGSAYMGLGQVYLRAPRIFGGDVQKAISYFEKGLKVGPNNGLMRLRLAQAYAEANRDNDAREQLKILFESNATPGYEPEYNDAVQEGRELEQKLK